MSKTYGQFCGLARALDHVGDRWTLLVVRELLLRDAGYGELREALDGVPTNLLADRLGQLEADGLLTRERSDEDARRVTYRLTPLGRGLEPALLALIEWGAHWMAPGPGKDRFDPRWALLALRALARGRRPPQRGTVRLDVDGGSIDLVSARGEPLRVEPGRAGGSPDATVSGPPAALLGVVAGQLTLAQAARQHGVRVRGDRALARTLLQP